MGYGVWLHGEAVATGMVMAADLSWRIGHIAKADAQRARYLIERAGLPVVPPADMGVEQFISLMSVDKKVQAGQIRFVLMRELGNAYVDAKVDEALLRETLAAGERLCQ